MSDDSDTPPDKADLLEWGKQRKAEANARHRARKRAAREEAAKAEQVDERMVQAAQLMAAEVAMAKLEIGQLQAENDALSAMQAYQEDAMQVLRLGALAERMDDEAALQGAAAAALGERDPAAARARGHATPPLLQELSASRPEGSDTTGSGSGGTTQQPSTSQQAPAGTSMASAGASGATSGALPSGPQPSGPQPAASGSGASGAAGAVDVDEAGKSWLRQLMEIPFIRDYWYYSHSVMNSNIIKLAALAMRFLPRSVILNRNKLFLEQLQHTVARWEALPAQRPQIEAVIAARFTDRTTIMTELARHRPADLLHVWGAVLCPAPPAGQAPSADGKPPIHDVLQPIAHFVEAQLSPAQLAQLERDWSAYTAAIRAARDARVTAALRLQYGASLHSMSWQKQATLAVGGSTADRSEAFTTMADSTGCLDSLGTEEMLAMVELQAALARVLSPIQMARVQLAAFPYNPDMTQLCPWLLTPRRGQAALDAAPAGGSTLTGRSSAAAEFHSAGSAHPGSAAAHSIGSGRQGSDAAASGAGAGGLDAAGLPAALGAGGGAVPLPGLDMVDPDDLDFLLAELGAPGDAAADADLSRLL